MTHSKYAIALSALATSGTTFAQSGGSLTYGPAATAPVPIPSLFLLPLGIALAFFGFRALRKQGGRQLLGALLLAGGVGMGAISSLNIQHAIAAMMIELNQPGGGTVDIPVENAIYTNTSGVALKIATVVAPPSCVTTAPADECVSGLVLEDSASCSTVYDCLPVVTVSKKSDGVESATPTPGGFTLTRTGDTTTALTVNYSLSGTATAGDDYSISSETQIEIPATQSSVDVDFTVLDDEVFDPNETVVLTIANGGYTVGVPGTATAAITASDKRLFVTASRYHGYLGGIAGADAKCNVDGSMPSDGSTYKAMIAGGGRSASPLADWVLTADTNYFRADDKTFIATTTQDRVFAFPLSVPIWGGSGVAWTGLSPAWSTSTSICQGWAPTTSSYGAVGSTSVVDSTLISVDSPPCVNFAHLICIEQ
ncbi:midcut-by-XrtH protein [Haliea sp. E17]|uniref:midcut-by-XrtH protein n=1 Tax=Haliea sp. E17 TaxID=3401576 RepID=UPI003AABE94E